MPVWCAKGVSVALDHFIETKATGTLPGGRANAVSVRVATAGALLVMKGMALNERISRARTQMGLTVLGNNLRTIAKLREKKKQEADDATTPKIAA
jgi:hypothetical protein